MATQEDENNVLSDEKFVNNETDTDLVLVCKKYDVILNDKSVDFLKKSEFLVEVWKTLRECSLKSAEIQDVIQIINWAKLHTLNVVLNGEWKNATDNCKESLWHEVKNTQNGLCTLNNTLHSGLQKLLDVIKNPWSDPTLEYLLTTVDATIGPKEIEFFRSESAYLTSFRLQKLCESQCEDLALNLVRSFMKCYRLSRIENFTINANETQIWFIFDICIALMFKFNEKKQLLEMLKALHPEEGLRLVRRFAKKKVNISKVWKHCQRVAILASQVYISSTVLKPFNEVQKVLRGLIGEYLQLSNSGKYINTITDSLRAIIRLVDSSSHIYLMCEVFEENFSEKMNPFAIESYIRALTTDMNTLEQQKIEDNKAGLEEARKKLANGFNRLAAAVQDDILVSRECWLTGFSLHPTAERLKKIEELARLSGYTVLDTGQEWKCKLHPPVLPSDELTWICNVCGDYMCTPQLNVPLNTNTALNEALTEKRLGIKQELCDDLVVLLSGPRYQVFSWLLDWPILHRLCLMYLNDEERTKNLITDLKYLEIDYSVFAGIKKEPIDEYAGIEKGYEHYLDQNFGCSDDISDLSEGNQYDSQMDSDRHESARFPFPQQQKSDPDTLKSLRMFRPNLKRPKGSINEESSNSWDTQLDYKRLYCSTSNDSLNFSNYSIISQPVESSEIDTAPLNLTSELTNQFLNNYSEINRPINSFENVGSSGSSPFRNGKGNVEPNSILSELLESPHSNHSFSSGSSTSKIRVNPELGRINDSIGSVPNNPTGSLFSDDIFSQFCEQLRNSNYKVSFTGTTYPSKKEKRAKKNLEQSPKNGKNAILQPDMLQVAETVEIMTTEPDSMYKEDMYQMEEFQLPLVEENHCIPMFPLEAALFSWDNKIGTSIWDRPMDTCTPTILTNSQASIHLENNNDTFQQEIQACKDEIVNFLNDDLFGAFPSDEINNRINNNIKKDSVFLEVSSQVYVPDYLSDSEIRLSNRGSDKNEEKYKNMNELESLQSKKITVNIKNKSKVESIIKNCSVSIERLSDSVLHACYKSQGKTDAKINEKMGNKLKCIKTTNKRKRGRPPKITSFLENFKVPEMEALYKKDQKRIENIEKTENKSIKSDKKRIISVLLEESNIIAVDKVRVYSNKNFKLKNEDSKLNKVPRVVLERLDFRNSNYVREVLSKVPGLKDTELIKPVEINPIVNVVQTVGGRPSSTVPIQNTQTSTQITPHIQRIGQPRVDDKLEAEQVDGADVLTANSATNTTIKTTTSQSSSLINILSQQIIRPGQSNSVKKSSPLINILSQQIIRPSQENLPKASTTGSISEQNPALPREEYLTESKSTNNVENVTSTTHSTNSVPVSQKSELASETQGTIVQLICKSALPKFQQAFGKPIYQNNSESSENNVIADNNQVQEQEDSNKKIPVQKTTLNLQPLQGNAVIYTRQVPINFIPPGQVFRIATSNSDPVIHSKMSALLAAALQGKKATTTETQDDADSNCENSEQTVTINRPSLVQNARIVKPVLQVPANAARSTSQTNLSSTTLEQLREFDMVFKQIKERSTVNTVPAESSTQSESSNDSSPQRISIAYLNQNQKFTQLSPVVVVSSYCNLQPASSPALSVTSQGSSSPCITPVSTPNLSKVSTKTSKGKSLKSATSTASKTSPIPKPQQKPQEDEDTTKRIFDILAEYAEQLRNSPDLNNKPAPRRRSNPPSNSNHSSKRKKGSSAKKTTQGGSMIMSDDIEDQRTMGSEDSSCGIVQLSVREDETSQSQTATESSETSTTNSRPIILTENATSTPQNIIIADSAVGETLKIQNTAVLVPGNYIMPVSMVKGGQQIAVVSGGSKILATVPARSGPNMLLFQSVLNQNRKPGVPTVKYSTLQPFAGIAGQNITSVSAQSSVILPSNSNINTVTLGQPLTVKKIDGAEPKVNTELLLTIAPQRENISVDSELTTNGNSVIQKSNKKEQTIMQTDSNAEKLPSYRAKPITQTSVATSVISQAPLIKNSSDGVPNQPMITLNIAQSNDKETTSKPTERVQSVLVASCTSNGPMLSHTNSRFRKGSDSTFSEVKETSMHNGGKTNADLKLLQTTSTYLQNKNKKGTTNSPKLDRELYQLCLQRKQAALEREFRLQKSLSEECEDLGVDEPSTSDLFPEADLLFDYNHSPSFDQTVSDIKKNSVENKERNSIILFSDDDNSGSLKADFLFENQYQNENAMQYDQPRKVTNGQNNTESISSCDDNTLLQNCASMSDVTLNSPISLDLDNSLNTSKYKFKYTNRKKNERQKQSHEWTGEVSSSEDTVGSSDALKTNNIPAEIFQEDQKVDENTCESHCDNDDDLSNRRGSRKSVKKMCTCCNGTQEGASRKRPTQGPQTPVPLKKAFLNKKR